MPTTPSEQAHEDAIRDVERVMLYIAEAQRKAEEIHRELATKGTEEYILTALQTTAAAMRAEHNRLLNKTHFVVPDEPLTEAPQDQEEDDASDQQRMAI